MLSPLLFNVYLEEALGTVPVLKKAISEGKLIAFADDILLVADDKQEAVQLIRGMESLKDVGLQLNKSKTVLMDDTKQLDGQDALEGIAIKKSFKYLGAELSCNRGAVIKDAKDKCKKHMAAIRGKV